MTETLLARVQILMQQERHEEAEQILGELLAKTPADTTLLLMLSHVQLEKGNTDHALELINNALSIEPDNSLLYHTKARIAIQKDEYDTAEHCLNEAIELNPGDADFFALLASIKLSRKKYQEALDIAETSLEIDAENIIALNTRSTALLKLGRKNEAFDAIEGALREDPDNSYTHMNYGWGLLEKGNTKKALEHFREALRNDPDNEYAQAGMAEALKARYGLYRLFLQYAFWMGNLTQRYQWAVIIGFYFGVRILRIVAKNNEALQPYLIPLIILLGIIAFSTWVISPISNLFLRLNKYGKHLLDKDEITSSNFVFASAIIFVLSIPLYALLGDQVYIATAIFGFTMMLPLSSMLNPARKKRLLLNYALGMAIIGLLSIYNTARSGELFSGYTVLYIFSFVAYQWVANYILIKEDNR